MIWRLRMLWIIRAGRARFMTALERKSSLLIGLVKKIIAEGISNDSSYKEELDLIVDKLFS